jgi:hypothetical protein
MKKSFLRYSAVFFFAFTAKAQTSFISVEPAQVNPQRHFKTEVVSQNLHAKVNSALINDTLQYFYNKHYYRNVANGTPTSPNTQFYSLFSPYTSMATNISHCGAVFLNSSSLTVNGLEGIVYKNPTSPSANVALKLYLCSVNAGNLPIFPPLDSVTTSVPNTPNGGIWVGGNFTTAVTVTGKFAVLFKNASTNPLDTLRLFINNASTATSTVPINQRFGEGLGVMRINGNFQLTTNTFGTGTDYEFIVAPRVSFTYSAGVSVLTPTICNNSTGSFSNTSSNVSIASNILENRQFNFNKFAAYWGALSNTILPQTQPDSIYNWTFTGSPITGTLNTKNASAIFNINGNQLASLTVKYKISANGGFYFSTTDVATANIFVSSTLAPSLTISGNNSICSGSSTTLTASGNTTFTWTSPASNASSIVVTPLANTVYSVSGGIGACIGSQTILVNVIGLPSLSIAGATAACEGSSLVLTASGASSYTWSNSANTPSISVTTSAAGLQSFTVVGQNGACPGTVTLTQNVNINALPSVSLTVANATLCTKATNGASITVIGSPSGGVYSGNVTSTGVFNPLSAGTFTANYTYTNSNTGCSKKETKILYVTDCTGLNSHILNQNVLVFPNPSANGVLNIINLEGVNTIAIYSMLGDLISSQITQNSEMKIDLTDKANGNYFIKITDANSQSKILKVLNQK